MFIVESYGLAVALCWVTMLCWGSWGNTQKLSAQTWRYELFYWDYVIGILLFSLVWGLTLGSMLVWRIFGALFWVASYSMPRIYCCRLPCRWLVCRLLSR